MNNKELTRIITNHKSIKLPTNTCQLHTTSIFILISQQNKVNIVILDMYNKSCLLNVMSTVQVCEVVFGLDINSRKNLIGINVEDNL